MRLYELNKSIENKLGYREEAVEHRKEEKAVVQKGSALEKYEDYLTKDAEFQMAFDNLGKDGTFSCYDGDCFLLLPLENDGKSYDEYSIRSIDRMIGKPFHVKVEKIDAEKKRVYLTIAGKSKLDREQAIKNSVNKEIEKILTRGSHPRVWGRIIKVEEGRALVDILDQNILGFIYIAHWQDGYVPSFKSVCKEGEYYQFDIERPAPKQGRKRTAWILSRRRIEGNPWKELDFTGIEEGAVMVVKCVDKPIGKPYWWGQADRLPGIAIMGDYNSKFNVQKGLVNGLKYYCKIVEFKNGSTPRDRKVKVTPFDVIPEDKDTWESCERIRQNKKTDEQ